MSFAERHKKGLIDWGIDTSEMEYFDLQSLFEMNGEDATYTLKGVFISSKKPEKQLKEFGPSVIGILEDKLVNLPSHMCEEVKEILATPEDIEDIKAGNAIFKIRTYEAYGKTCYGVDWQEPSTKK